MTGYAARAGDLRVPRRFSALALSTNTPLYCFAPLQICLLQQTGRRCMPALELLVAALCHESVPAAAVAVMAGDYELLRVLCATGRQAAVAAEVNAEVGRAALRSMSSYFSCCFKTATARSNGLLR
jgi:hypothetical protein